MKLLALLLLTTSIYALNFDTAIQQIKHHEGFRSSPYKDNGHLSVGYGTNLSHITRAEAHLLLVHRLSIRLEQLKQYSWFRKLSPNRQNVVLNMSYQLGMTGLLKFKHMIWRLKHGYWKAAANAMVNSRWYRQSGHRSKSLVKQMIKG